MGRYHGTEIRRSRGYAFAFTDGKAKSEAKPAENVEAIQKSRCGRAVS